MGGAQHLDALRGEVILAKHIGEGGLSVLLIVGGGFYELSLWKISQRLLDALTEVQHRVF